MKCPRCTKPGELQLVHIHAPGSREGGWKRVPCRLCGGTNEIDEEVGRHMEIGKALRDVRVGQCASQSERAKTLGVSAVTLARVEMGQPRMGGPEAIALWNRLVGASDRIEEPDSQ